MLVTEDRLRTLLRVAESAHEAYEKERGAPDDDWPTWYAAFIIARLEEEPEGAAHRLDLDDEEQQLLAARCTRISTTSGTRKRMSSAG